MSAAACVTPGRSVSKARDSVGSPGSMMCPRDTPAPGRAVGQAMVAAVPNRKPCLKGGLFTVHPPNCIIAAARCARASASATLSPSAVTCPIFRPFALAVLP